MNLSQIFKVFILSLIFTSSCGFKRNSFENYSNSINESLNPNFRSLKAIQNIDDVKDMKGCGTDIELGGWYKDKILSKSLGREIWSRSISEYDHGIIGSGEHSLDYRKKYSSHIVIKNPDYHVLYIGPWEFVKKIGKEIRFVAYTGWGGGDILSHFESKNDKNEVVPEKQFYLNAKIHNVTNRIGLCGVKWIANNGYNSISKVKSRNPFSKNYMVPTGELIEVPQ